MINKKNNRTSKCIKNIALFIGLVTASGLLLFYPADKAACAENEGTNKDYSTKLESAFEKAKSSKDGAVSINMDDQRIIQDTVQKGDLVSVNYTIALQNGDILSNTGSLAGNESGIKKSIYYMAPPVSGPVNILAGEHDRVPGLSKAVLGIKLGETKRMIVPVNEAYGPINEEKKITFSSVRAMTKKMQMPLNGFKEKYNVKPEKGGIVPLTPYFSYLITDIQDDQILLKADVEKTMVSEDSLGIIKIEPEEENIKISLEPKIGADFEVGNEKGKITSVVEKSFTVDLNHPLAGKELVLDVTVESFIKASDLKDLNILWNEDYQKGSETARKERKPEILVFYKEGCPWCKKLFDETMEDPRVTYLYNDYVWVKTDGEKYPELMDTYEMDSYPSILLLNSKGDVVDKVAGYQSAPVLRDWLNSALNKINKAPVNLSDAGKHITKKLP